jgi:sodium transport system permease protein
MINWKNVRLVYAREIRDQMRDRRTLFTIAVLPLLLYPLMGMGLMHVAQFMKESPSRIWIVGAENLPTAVPLLDGPCFDDKWCNDDEQRLIEMVDCDVVSPNDTVENSSERTKMQFVRELAAGNELSNANQSRLQSILADQKIDVLVVIPAGFADQTGVATAIERSDTESQERGDQANSIRMIVSSSSEKSAMGAGRVSLILRRWKEAIVAHNLKSRGIVPATIDPFSVETTDIASASGKTAAMWSKILPFVVMIWALTGAFYPAIDLVAGEKERGTLETLLTSPAKRIELVAGKMLTVMTFSMCTSLLNLASMGFTGLFVMGQLSGMAGAASAFELGTPPIVAVGWLVLGLIPISATFSALALAVASFAKSSKEGQYYLVPLLIMTLPLMMLPMMPGVQLDLGMSFIPVSGMMLLLKGLIEGQWMESARYAAPVIMVSCVGCWLSIRWAVHQFNSESVLFRESERFGIGVWLKHLMRERGPLPTPGEAILCGVAILLVKFFISFAAQLPTSFGIFAQQTIIVLLAAIAVPAVLMALVLTRSPQKTLKLTMPQWWTLPAAFCIALLFHPAMMSLTQVVLQLYPPSENLGAFQSVIDQILGSAPNIFAVLAVMAIAPAIAEELAFRGFILSGMEKLNHKWGAVLITSLFFAATHGVIQQSMMAFVTGGIIGIVAVQTRSIFPCMIYHATHNGASILMSQLDQSTIASSSVLRAVFNCTEVAAGRLAIEYSPIASIAMTIAGIILFASLFRIRIPMPTPKRCASAAVT